MSVTLTFVDQENNTIARFPAEDYKSISQIAEKNGLDIPVSCCRGACYVCACKIKSGVEFIQIDKIMPPAVLPARNEKGERKELFSCVSGITSEAIKDEENHEVVLEKRF